MSRCIGGLSALGNEVQLKRNGEDIRFPTGKVLAQFLKKGDVSTLRSGGGGGCGSPLERKLDDVENEAKELYLLFPFEAARDDEHTPDELPLSHIAARSPFRCW